MLKKTEKEELIKSQVKLEGLKEDLKEEFKSGLKLQKKKDLGQK